MTTKKQVWRIDYVRFEIERGENYSIRQTGDLIIAEYNRQKVKPVLITHGIGLMMALYDYLHANKIPIKLVKLPKCIRIGNAKIYKGKK